MWSQKGLTIIVSLIFGGKPVEPRVVLEIETIYKREDSIFTARVVELILL